MAAYGEPMESPPSWRILSSSALRAVSYDEHAAELRVRFVNGSVYRYHDVPPEVAEELVDPPGGSHGSYFAEQIRDSYDFEEER